MTIVGFEQQVAEFIETVYRRDQLRQEFRRVYEAVDLFGADLDADAFHCLLNNARASLDALAAELDVAEQSTAALYPQVRVYLDEEEEFPAAASFETRSSPPVDAAAAAKFDADEGPDGDVDGGNSEGYMSEAVEVDAEPDAFPWEEEETGAEANEKEGTADTVAPESPFDVDVPTKRLVAKDGDSSASREEEMLFWLNEREKEAAASEDIVPRNTPDGMGHPAEMGRFMEEDNEVTQIFNKGGMA